MYQKLSISLSQRHKEVFTTAKNPQETYSIKGTGTWLFKIRTTIKHPFRRRISEIEAGKIYGSFAKRKSFSTYPAG